MEGLCTHQRSYGADYYVIYNHPTRSFDDLKTQYKDRVFLCADGTFTNLQQILADLTLANISLGGYVGDVKYDILAQLARELIVAGKMTEFPACEMVEIHNVSSLVNVVAEEMGVKYVSQQEDVYVWKTISPTSKALYCNAIADTFLKKDFAEDFLRMILGRITANLPEFRKHIPGEATSFFSELSKQIENLRIEGLTADMLLELDEDYTPLGYKPQAADILLHALAVHFQHKGLIRGDISFSEAILKLESKSDPEVGITEETWRFIQQSPHKDKIQDYLYEHRVKFDTSLIQGIASEGDEESKATMCRMAIAHGNLEFF